MYDCSQSTAVKVRIRFELCSLFVISELLGGVSSLCVCDLFSCSNCFIAHVSNDNFSSGSANEINVKIIKIGCKGVIMFDLKKIL